MEPGDLKMDNENKESIPSEINYRKKKNKFLHLKINLVVCPYKIS